MSRIITLALAVCLAFASGCKDDAKTDTGGGAGTTGGGGGGAASGATPAASAPTKESAIRALQEAAAALEAKDYDKALVYIHVPPGKTPEQFKTVAPGIIEKQQVSTKGAGVLAAHGKWGKLDEVLSKEQAEGFANGAGVPLEQCYGLTHGEAHAALHWNGQQFKIIHLEAVGKLTQ